jgi:hypothetical protein
LIKLLDGFLVWRSEGISLAQQVAPFLPRTTLKRSPLISLLALSL